MADYANPNALVTTEWVLGNVKNPNVRVVEVDVDTKGYDEGHVPGAVGWNWQTQLCDQLQRDIISRAALEKLLGSSGIDNNTTVVLYGDNNNWFAAWAYWQLKVYGHKDVKLMNGGRKKWLAEGRELSRDVPSYPAKTYKAGNADNSIRAFLHEARQAMDGAKAGKAALVDVRSPDEYTGKILSPPGLPETCQRGGHIPGAVSIPWGQACNEDGTFKSADALAALYGGKGVTKDKDVVAYCRIGERSSHTWFVLRELLGYPKVRNYDGSWTEWGNLVAAPVEK
jgi:thiosulfate/3-mercaptopyruvate sulfurtransferase